MPPLGSCLAHTFFFGDALQLDRFSPKEVCLLGLGTRTPAAAVDLAVEPARRVGVTIQATYLAVEVGQLSKGLTNGRGNCLLVILGDVLLDLLGLLNLSFNDLLDGEEAEVLVLKETLEEGNVLFTGFFVEVFNHSWELQHYLEKELSFGVGDF